MRQVYQNESVFFLISYYEYIFFNMHYGSYVHAIVILLITVLPYVSNNQPFCTTYHYLLLSLTHAIDALYLSILGLSAYFEASKVNNFSYSVSLPAYYTVFVVSEYL